MLHNHSKTIYLHVSKRYYSVTVKLLQNSTLSIVTIRRVWYFYPGIWLRRSRANGRLSAWPLFFPGPTRDASDHLRQHEVSKWYTESRSAVVEAINAVFLQSYRAVLFEAVLGNHSRRSFSIISSTTQINIEAYCCH